MCSSDDADPVTLINSGEYRRARKDHRCDECRRQIAAGERYHYETFVFDGRFSQHKTCEHCMAARDWLQAECSGFVYGHVPAEIVEHVTDNHGYYGMGLARMAVSCRQKWRRRNGSLRPVPVRPPTSYDKRKAQLETT